MIDAPDLTKLGHAEKDALILALLRQLAAAEARIAAQDAWIAALEARLAELTDPAKTPDNSSKPPSQGQRVCDFFPTRINQTDNRSKITLGEVFFRPVVELAVPNSDETWLARRFEMLNQHADKKSQPQKPDRPAADQPPRKSRLRSCRHRPPHQSVSGAWA